MSRRRKICAVTANRADFSKIETILREIKKRPDLDLRLVVLGSHLLDKTGRTVEEIKNKGFEVHFALQMEVEGATPVSMAKSVGLAMVELTSVLDHFKPDVVLAPVDRFESLAIGATAALMNIYVAHVEGGEVTGTIDESIRHALTKLSHLHFVATEASRQRVIKMGEPAEYVFNVGSAGTDLLLEVPPKNRRQSLKAINDFIRHKKGYKHLNATEPYILMTQHPVTTEFQSAGEQIAEIMEAVKNFKGQLIILWPNIDAGSDDISKVLRRYLTDKKYEKKISIFKHLPTEIFVNLMRNASCVIGNSSSGVREASYFGTPVVNIGSRQEGRERGKNVMDAPCERKLILKAINAQIAHGKYQPEKIYGEGDAGRKIAEALATVKLPNIQKKITY